MCLRLLTYLSSHQILASAPRVKYFFFHLYRIGSGEIVIQGYYK
jgi:hypothetical protein